jgi:tellurite resistance protein
MGIFDKIFGSSDPASVTLTQQEAFFAIMLLVVAADGEIADSEVISMYGVTKRMKLYAGLPENQHVALIKKLAGILKKHGPKVLLEKAAATLPANLKPTAFAVATDLAFADGTVENEERAILEAIYQHLGLAQEQATKIIEVIMIKNQG